MPRNGSGTYTLPEPSFTPGSVISSTAMNSDMTDIALALTGSVSADGQTPITGQFKLADGTAAIPSYSFVTNTTDGIYHPSSGQVAFAIAGTQTLTVQAPSATVGGGLTGVSGAVLNPIGVLADFAGSAAPTGWFLCYGQTVSRTTYVELFTAIGTAWGAGDGSTTFGIPDLRGRATYGQDNMGGVAASRITNAISGIVGTTLGASGGDQSAQSHTHGLTGNSGGQNVDHTHTYTAPNATFPGTGGGLVVSQAPTGPLTTGGTSNDHVHSLSSGSATNSGAGASQNMPPAAIVNKIIFAGHP